MTNVIPDVFKRVCFCAFLLLLAFAVPASALHKVDLDVEIDIARSRIDGVVKTYVTGGVSMDYLIGTLEISAVRLDGKDMEYVIAGPSLTVVPPHDGELVISYYGIFEGAKQKRNPDNPYVPNEISERGVSLTNIWYPSYDGLNYYDLRVYLPAGFRALSEAEWIEEKEEGGRVFYRFYFPHKVDGINLVASSDYRVISDEFRGTGIYAYFFESDADLAKEYIEYTKQYLELYEGLIGKYPYKRFSIVENFLPTGYSMPTYTLLGSRVVKLPFIVETSLGHEILHQWFGNSVYIDYEKGNWAEGLTTYLADHLYREQKGEGWQYRKQILVDYKSYVHEDLDVPLAEFRGRVDRPSRAVGYGKTAMVFHMLKGLVGEELFYEALKDLITNMSFRRASWRDIRRSFEKVSGKPLGLYFHQWINERGLPELTLHSPEITQSGSDFTLHFHIDQEGEVYKMYVPVTVFSGKREITQSVHVTSRTNSFDIELPFRPHRIVLDRDYDIARVLEKEEYPFVIARLLGERGLVMALSEEDAERYGGFVEEFERRGASAKSFSEITLEDIESGSLIIMGREHPLVRRLFGSIVKEDAGFSIVMKSNPWNPDKLVAVIDGTSKIEVDAALRKLPHYGKYSKLLFNRGRNIGKEIERTKRGIEMSLNDEAAAIAVSSVKTLSDVIEGVKDKKIVYVGELHDVFAHHAVQLDVISGVHKGKPRIAIGMEMFQRPFQEALNNYVEGRTSEMDFLKETEYFKRWGFDYQLYKPILDFARNEKVPVVALNLRKEIVEKVSREGIDALSEEEKAEVPAELDFSDSEYRERLVKIFEMHEGNEERNFNYFFQAQVLWDETMSESVDNFLKDNPDYSMVVLAGQGHLQYGSGIPSRTFRRNGYDYATVLIDEKIEAGIADYVVFPKPVDGVTTPKLMVYLNIADGTVTVVGFSDNSVSEKAGVQENDVILELDGTEVETIEDIKLFLATKKRGDVVKVRILRTEDDRDKELNIDVTL